MDYIYKKDIEALVDNELSEDATTRLKETIKAFPALQEYHRKLLRQKQLLKGWWILDKKKHH